MHPMMQSLLSSAVYKFRGRLAAKPEARYFESGASVANVSMAVDPADKKKDDGRQPAWYKLEVWNDDVESFVNGLDKGQLIDVEGRVKSETYKNRQGEDVHQWVIKVHSWAPVGTPKPAAAATTTAKPAAAVWGSSSADEPGDEEVPF